MSDEIRVLGVDLASSRWGNNGSAVIVFRRHPSPVWVTVQTPAIAWPNVTLNAETMAAAIDDYVRANGIHAASLDGPQGWRDPNAPVRAGVGRWCEYQAHTQGKTGPYGRTYPQTQMPWIRFCIDVFERLRHTGRTQLVNDPDARNLGVLDKAAYWLLECYPTSTWRTSDLIPLPGKGNTTLQQLRAFAQTLWARFRFPGLPPDPLSHDDLQAVVAALPGVALLGGPCLPDAKGQSGREVEAPNQANNHWVEGIIWDATLPEEDLDQDLELPEILLGSAPPMLPQRAKNPIVIDERDDHGEELLRRGGLLFRYLVAQANAGNAVGVGYKQSVSVVHGADYDDVMGRGFSRADVSYVLELAAQVCVSSGGRQAVTRQGTTIQAGMDTFIWQRRRPHSRSPSAFKTTPYTEAEWQTVLPTGQRRMLREDEIEDVLGG